MRNSEVYEDTYWTTFLPSNTNFFFLIIIKVIRSQTMLGLAIIYGNYLKKDFLMMLVTFAKTLLPLKVLLNTITLNGWSQLVERQCDHCGVIYPMMFIRQANALYMAWARGSIAFIKNESNQVMPLCQVKRCSNLTKKHHQKHMMIWHENIRKRMIKLNNMCFCIW